MKELPLISQTFWTTKDLKTEETAKKIADLMAVREDEFMPTAFFGGKITENRNKKYDKSKVAEYVKALNEPDEYYVVLSNNHRKKCEVTFEFTVTKSIWFNVVNFKVAHSYLLGKSA